MIETFSSNVKRNMKVKQGHIAASVRNVVLEKNEYVFICIFICICFFYLYECVLLEKGQKKIQRQEEDEDKDKDKDKDKEEIICFLQKKIDHYNPFMH